MLDALDDAKTLFPPSPALKHTLKPLVKVIIVPSSEDYDEHTTKSFQVYPSSSEYISVIFGADDLFLYIDILVS